MDVVALKYSGSSVLHGRSPLLRLQSDEHLIALTRRGNDVAFETLVKRYEVRLLAFCRHMLSSREDAEDVLQEVMAAAYNAIVADERPINARPWLYRIARNRCLNHLRRVQPIGVDSMDVHFSDNGASTADKAGEREAFQMLVDDIQDLPETQKTALVLRELEALSYEQISEAMETTVPAVKSLLVRARASLAEAAEARLLSCEEVRIELAEAAEGLRRRPSPPVRRHVKTCEHCSVYAKQMRHTGRALAALSPVGPLALLHKLSFGKIALGAWSHGSSAAGTAAASSSGAAAAAGTGAVAATGAAAGSSGLITAGVSALTTKAVAGLAAAALVTAGAVAANKPHRTTHHPVAVSAATTNLLSAAQTAAPAGAAAGTVRIVHHHAPAAAPHNKQVAVKVAPKAKTATTTTSTTTTSVTTAAAAAVDAASAAAAAVPLTTTTPDSGGVGLTTADGSTTTASETRSGSTGTGTTTTGTSTTPGNTTTTSGNTTTTGTSTDPDGTTTTPTNTGKGKGTGTSTTPSTTPTGDDDGDSSSDTDTSSDDTSTTDTTPTGGVAITSGNAG